MHIIFGFIGLIIFICITIFIIYIIIRTLRLKEPIDFTDIIPDKER